MDSINQQQSEENRKDFHGNEAVKKIKEMADTAKSCFFCTKQAGEEPLATRPMAPQKIDEHGNLWFLSSDDSHKNDELSENSFVQLFFQGGHHSDFMMLYGKATVSKNKEKIKELWEPVMKTWFTEGEDDPRITVIKVTPDDGYYWDTKHGTLVAFAKQLVGAATGKTLDDSIEGKLTV